MSTLMHASRQWSSRPADERFSSLADLRARVALQRHRAVEADGVPLRSLRTEARGDEVVVLGDQNVPSRMTHWSFGQMCRAVSAPAGYLRQLPAGLASQNLNNGLARADKDRREQLLFERNGDHLLRGFTTDVYKRVWNLDVVDAVATLCSSQPWWQPAPAAFDGSRGLYASDEDVFMFMVDNDRRIFEKQDGGLSRGFMVSNSEVGKSSFWLMTFFYEYVCGNHRVWGASGVREFRIPHVGNADRKVFAALGYELRKYAGSSAAEDEQRIERAHQHQLGASKENVVDAVWSMPKRPQVLTQSLIERAYDRAEQMEQRYGSPRSAWGFTGGLTELAREEPNGDDRVAIDRAAGAVLKMAF